MSLNEAAYELARPLLDRPGDLGVAVQRRGGATVVDCGVDAAGSAEAGLLITRIAMGGLGEPRLLPPGGAAECFVDIWPGMPWPAVEVRTAAPPVACLAAQYAGWKVATDGYYAMASGPIRAAIGRERLYDAIGHRERPAVAVGILESGTLPPAEACGALAAAAGVMAERLILLVARTASVAGGLQVVARSVETALHKLHDLSFAVDRIVAGVGVAPLPPVATRDLAAIGRTNDAILYGGRVVLDVAGGDADLAAIGPRCVSSGSAAHGESFLTLFERAGRDFYAVDPALFAPAAVEFVSVETGRRQRFGAVAPDLVAASFATGPSR
ncbi:MAG: methenyltetrahydromethanopterin cyclohydrolase [Planctomycetaceae bacterium]